MSAWLMPKRWRRERVLGELADEHWDVPTTIAKVGGELLVVCSQLGAPRPEILPFTIAASEFPSWPA
jgi:hypothetical protein